MLLKKSDTLISGIKLGKSKFAIEVPLPLPEVVSVFKVLFASSYSNILLVTVLL